MPGVKCGRNISHNRHDRNLHEKSREGSPRLNCVAWSSGRTSAGDFKRELRQRIVDAAVATRLLGFGESRSGPVFEVVVVGFQIRFDHGAADADADGDDLVLVDEYGLLDRRADT